MVAEQQYRRRLGQFSDLVFVQVVFGDDFLNEVPLLGLRFLPPRGFLQPGLDQIIG